jgi:hypothetical protein
LVLGALPLLLLALSNDWCFTPTGFVDPWVYFGYYQNLPRHLTIFDGTYYGTRLTTLLPGYVAYRWLPPLLANYVLHVGLYYACVVSLYLILARTVSPRVGLLGAVCLGCQYFFLRAIGWDYIDGFGIAYFLLSVLALTTAAGNRFWKCSLVAAGVGSAAFVIANVFYVFYLPYFAIHYLYVNRQTRRNPLLVSLGWYILGAIGLTLALCSYNEWITGRFWFLGPTLHFARIHVAQANRWKVPVSTWLLAADWLALPALTALGSIFYFYRFRPGSCGRSTAGSAPVRSAGRDARSDSSAAPQGAPRARHFAVLYQMQFLFALVMMIGWEWWGQPVLQWLCYASLLLPATLLALAAQLDRHVERLSSRQFGALFGMVLLFLVAPYAPNNCCEWLPRLKEWSGGLTVAVGTLGLAVVAFRRPGTLSCTAIIFLFISMPGYVAWHTFGVPKALSGTEFVKQVRPTAGEHSKAADILRSVFDADKVVRRWDPAGQAHFWYRFRAPMGEVYDAVCSTYLWGYRLVNVEFPALVDPAAFVRLKGQRVVILSADPEALVKANAAMESVGLEAQLLAEERIDYPSVAFTMSYVAIKRAGFTEQPLTARFDHGADQGSLTVTTAADHPPLPPEKWHPCFEPPRMSLESTQEGVRVTTATERWAYALVYSVLNVAEEGDYRFDLSYTLQNGDIAFGALSGDESQWIAQAGPGCAPIALETPGLLVKSFTLRLKAGQTFRLLLTNNHPSGDHPSRLVVHEVRAVRETSTSQARVASRTPEH